MKDISFITGWHRYDVTCKSDDGKNYIYENVDQASFEVAKEAKEKHKYKPNKLWREFRKCLGKPRRIKNCERCGVPMSKDEKEICDSCMSEIN